ncbi:hypothetical protein M407DRAFT_243628 [Tulasnella calospora MUT 4182]|uniref:Uncharacterized protein n=1 Tax=Tulasnella calospora MUT 4182 TaxID=1051891 RepID=A0A0C3QIF3_9AGAM|nr:hypothetical protein M407DRAFT_243628 [Tulasnella calospora MUT 4182]
MSAMPLLSSAVFLSVAELNLEGCDELLAHLECTSPNVCEVEIGDNPGGATMRRSLLSASNQLYSNGTFGRWDARRRSGPSAPESEEIESEEVHSEDTESGSDSVDESDI